MSVEICFLTDKFGKGSDTRADNVLLHGVLVPRTVEEVVVCVRDKLLGFILCGRRQWDYCRGGRGGVQMKSF